ncbi:hypothetical protein MRX96_020477 [Rhipicephalus microplus]
MLILDQFLGFNIPKAREVYAKKAHLRRLTYVGRRRPGPQALHECRADGPGWDAQEQPVRPLEGPSGSESRRRETADQLCRLPRWLPSRQIPGSAMTRTLRGKKAAAAYNESSTIVVPCVLVSRRQCM